MNTPLHVLIVEDVSDDAILMVDALREGGFKVTWKRVDTAPAMREALADRAWDLVLCDFGLPQFSSEEAMAIAAELAPDVPLIVVTGTIGEERLADAMRAGARDFVQKQKLGRLVPAVLRELDAARNAVERRRLEQALRREQQKYRAMVEKSADAVSILDQQGQVVYGSPSTEHVLGYDSQEVLGRSAFDFVYPGDLPNLETEFAALARDPHRVLHRELRFVRKDGSARWVEVDAANLLDDPDVHGVVVNYRDVTDRKIAEEERRKDVQRTQALLELLQNPNQPPEEIIDRAVNQVVAMTGSEFGFVGAVDATQSVMAVHLSTQAVARCGMEAKWPLEFSVAPGGLWSAAIKEQQVVVLNDYQAPSPWKKGFPAGHLDIKRFIGVPVVRHNKTVLVCALANKAEAYDDSDVMHIRLFLEGVCGALDSNRKDQALRRNEKYYRALTERSADLVAVLRRDGVITYDSPAVERILGWRRSELIGRNALDLLHPGDRNRVRRLFVGHALRDGSVDSAVFKYQHRDGSWRVLEANIQNLLRDPDIAGIVVNARDISLRVRAVEELQRNQQRLQAIVDHNPAVIYLLSIEPNDVKPSIVSENIQALLGVAANAAEANGWWPAELHPQDRVPALLALQAARTGTDMTVQYRLRHTDGSYRWIEDKMRVVRDDTGAPKEIVGVWTDMTQRKHAEARRDLQFELTRILAESAPIGETAPRIVECLCRNLEAVFGTFWMLDRGTKALRCGTTWSEKPEDFATIANVRQMLTIAKGVGFAGTVWAQRQTTWMSPIDPAALQLPSAVVQKLDLHGALGIPIAIRDDIVGVIECFRANPGAPDEESIALFGTLGAQIGQFIERKQLEEQFRQAQKMEALGTLAGGIAHDFNNILSAITGYAELAKLQMAQNPKATQQLEGVLAGTHRAVELVRQILAFSRRQPQQRKPISLRPVVEEALKMLRAMIPPTIEFDLRLAPSTATVLADATQVHQVLMNLGANAAHAMRDRPGRLTVLLENTVIDPKRVDAPAELRPGKYVRVSVTDTGKGMDESTLARIFEPFFTTKQPGEGTGLGLAVVHGIMRSHEGVVTVRSSPGMGAVFDLYFPAIDVEEIEKKSTAADLPHGNGERILYIDDEQPLAEIGAKVLTRLGYTVDARTNPEEALAAIVESPSSFDLVVTDQMMPRLIGSDLAKQVRSIRPDLPVLLVTGYAATLTADDLRRSGVRKMLFRPMTVEALAAAVHAVLTGR